jgi:hypothetical protein
MPCSDVRITRCASDVVAELKWPPLANVDIVGQLTQICRSNIKAATLVGALDKDASNTRYYGLAKMS